MKEQNLEQELFYLYELKSKVESALNGNRANALVPFKNWYAESRELFRLYIDNNDEEYKRFAFYDRMPGNGYGVSSALTDLEGHWSSLIGVLKNITKTDNNMYDNKKIFIVHGHDEIAKLEVTRFTEGLGLEAVILNEQVNSGQTLVEKLISNTDVGYAIVLYTPCDSMNNLHRARQNVVFEHGYFIGHLGRDRITILRKDNVEMPTDISGIVYHDMDSGGGWKQKVAKELEAANYSIDYSKIK